MLRRKESKIVTWTSPPPAPAPPPIALMADFTYQSLKIRNSNNYSSTIRHEGVRITGSPMTKGPIK